MAICDDRHTDLILDTESVSDSLLRCVDDADLSLSLMNDFGDAILSLQLGVDLTIESGSDESREVIRLLETMLTELKGGAA